MSCMLDQIHSWGVSHLELPHRYPHIEDQLVATWTHVEARHTMREHDADDDGQLDMKEVTDSHDDLWFRTHPPNLGMYLRDEL